MPDLVVYAAGGGMRGIFGAGALHALAEMGARDRAVALYGISAGAFNIAHFALGSTTRAMEWYLHHVPERGILARATPVALIRGEDVIDVPEAVRVIETERLIDAEALARSPVPVFFGVVEHDRLAFRWVDARRPDAVRVLLASSTIFPFVHEPVVIDGVPCIDGGYREAVCHTRLRREHPDARLLLVLNDHEDESILRRMAVGAVLRLRDERLAEVWLETIDRTPAELAEAMAAPRTLVLKPDEDFPVHFATTNVAVLAHGFWLGYRAVLKDRDRIQRFLEGE
jgi:predicted patatin/cPLA2 family phospholipase